MDGRMENAVKGSSGSPPHPYLILLCLHVHRHISPLYGIPMNRKKKDSLSSYATFSFFVIKSFLSAQFLSPKSVNYTFDVLVKLEPRVIDSLSCPFNSFDSFPLFYLPSAEVERDFRQIFSSIYPQFFVPLVISKLFFLTLPDDIARKIRRRKRKETIGNLSSSFCTDIISFLLMSYVLCPMALIRWSRLEFSSF